MYWQHGGEDHPDAVHARQFRHGRVVGLDVFVARGTGNARYIVGAGEHDQHFGMQIDHVLTKAHQHLRSRLAINAAVEVRPAGEIIGELPVVGDGVAQKYDAILACPRWPDRRIGLAIAFQLTEVIGIYGDARGAVVVKPGRAGGRDGGSGNILLGERSWTNYRKQKDGPYYAQESDMHIPP